MNIIEEEQLEEKFNEITDQIGYLLLDFLLISLKKIKFLNLMKTANLKCIAIKIFLRNQQGANNKITPIKQNNVTTSLIVPNNQLTIVNLLWKLTPTLLTVRYEDCSHQFCTSVVMEVS